MHIDNRTKIVRAIIREKSKAKATKPYVLNLLIEIGLPQEEHNCILWHDVDGSSMDVVADKLHMCPRNAKKIHRNALKRIADICGI